MARLSAISSWRAGGIIGSALASLALLAAVWYLEQWQSGAPGVGASEVRGLITADGRPFDRRQLLGHPSVFYFGFTRCPDMCPMMIARLVAARKQLGPQAQDVAIVFITVDPEYDTLDRLRAFGQSFGGPIIAVTGSKAAINAATDAAAVFVKTVRLPNGKDTIDHTTSGFVYDRDGLFVDAVLADDSKAVMLQRLRHVIDQPVPTASDHAPAGR